MSGIGPLTARNFDGRGVRVIVAGVRSKGDAELYNCLEVNYEDWWSKKWSPGLVRTRYGSSYDSLFFSVDHSRQ
jgi:fatty acid synthase subunit alpha